MVGGYTNNNKYAIKLPSSAGSNKVPKIDTSYKTNLGGNLTSPVIGLGSSKLPTKIPTSFTTPTLKMPDISSQFNGSVVRVGAGGVGGVGGGSSGRVTKEGVIIGGGAVNSTFNNISSGKKTATPDLSYGANAGVSTIDKNKTLLESLKNQTPKQPITQPTTKPAAPQQPTTPPEQTEEHIDSYEEFLQKSKDTQKENLDKTNQLIEEQKQAALASAETARQRSVADARSSYEQNKATYGANAEALAGMGLSGSGYSDYINAQAYAQQRGDVQNANAVAAAERTAAESEAGQKKLSAELSYSENIAKADEALAKYREEEAAKKDSYYANLLNYANNGTYTSDQLAQLGAQYGLSNEQLTTLQQAATQYKTEKNNAYFNELLSYANNGTYTADQLSQLGTNYGLDATQIKSLTDAAGAYETAKYGDNNAALIENMLKDTSNYNDSGILTESGKNKILKFIEENKDSLGSQRYNFYKNYVNSMEVYTEEQKQKEETVAREEEQKVTDQSIITGQVPIEYNGKYYTLTSSLDDGANQIKRNNDFKDKLKALGYSDPFDKNIPNGTTIKSNVDNRGSNDFNFWDDIGAFLFSPLGAGAWDSWGNWNEITMTYYNGHWYLSQEA